MPGRPRAIASPCCATAQVSTSAFYDWLERSALATDADWDEAILVNEVHRVHDLLDDTYASPP